MIPSLIMALLSSRVLVFWLLNILMVICVAVATRRLYKDRGRPRVSTATAVLIGHGGSRVELGTLLWKLQQFSDY